jgi:hypothetical protein
MRDHKRLLEDAEPTIDCHYKTTLAKISWPLSRPDEPRVAVIADKDRGVKMIEVLVC